MNRAAGRRLERLNLPSARARGFRVLAPGIAKQNDAETKKVTGESQLTDSGLLGNAARRLNDDVLGREAGTAVLLALEGVPARIRAIGNANTQ